MPKRLSFEIEYQKEIDRCKHKIAVLSADGHKASFIVAALTTAVELAEEARASKVPSFMITNLKRMQEFLK